MWIYRKYIQNIIKNLAVAVVLAICVNEVRQKAVKSAIQTVTFLPHRLRI